MEGWCVELMVCGVMVCGVMVCGVCLWSDGVWSDGVWSDGDGTNITWQQSTDKCKVLL